MLKYFINLFILFSVVSAHAQDILSSEKTQKKDSITYKTPYGIRIGVDISKPILSLISKNTYSGLELSGDYRITKDWYVASELGYENRISDEEVLKTTSNGTFMKIGANYNAYENWLDMNNEIYFGTRYGFAFFNQTLNSYTPNVKSIDFPSETKEVNKLMDNLNIHWLEFQLGIKVETLKNLFLGFNGSYRVALSTKQPKDFKVLYAPGFNRVFASNTGFGFSYTISYLIPFRRKEIKKNIKKEVKNEVEETL